MAEPITQVLGIVSIKNRGEYNPETTYEKLNTVRYQGQTYCAKTNTQGNLPTNGNYWDLMVEKGEKGDAPVKGVDYWTASDKAEIETDLASDVTSEVTDQLSDLTSAAPLAANSIADMTDTTRIYVNTTDGHWYWYNGTTWVDGGVYQAAVNPIEVENVTEYTRNINTKSVGRYKANSSTGVISHNETDTLRFGMSDKTRCLPNTEYALSYNVVDNIKCTIYASYYDENGDFLSNQSFSAHSVYLEGGYVTTPADCYYIHVYIYNANGINIDKNSNIQIEEGYVYTSYIPFISAKDDILRYGKIKSLDVNEKPGYFNADGSIAPATTTNQEKYTQKYDLSLLSSIQIDISYQTPHSTWIACALYDENEDFIERIILKNDGANTSTKFGGNLKGLNGKYVAFCYRKFSDGVFKVTATLLSDNIDKIAIDALEIANDSKTKADSALEIANGMINNFSIGNFAARFKPCYDHLFVIDHNNVSIPHESLYHVRISKSMGFNMIEANLGKTSDGVYVVNHFNSGAFGNYFHHVDGVTDISNTLVSSVTWDWIKENVRYNSSITKYQTRPPRLEEFLGECRQQNIIPFIDCKLGAEIIEIADKYMGKNNYIAYGATRNICPTGIIYQWRSYTTKEEILSYCNIYGKPFIYGMANPTAFTDEELKDIIDTLHENGYWIGTSYVDTDWYKYSYMGFDVNGTQLRINRIENGNICNIDSIFGFDDFNFTNAVENDGVLTFTSDGTLSPDFSNSLINVGGIDFEISFIGTITIPTIGKHVSTTYTSDGTYPLFISVPIINGSNQLTINVEQGTIINDVKFKASKF